MEVRQRKGVIERSKSLSPRSQESIWGIERVDLMECVALLRGRRTGQQARTTANTQQEPMELQRIRNDAIPIPNILHCRKKPIETMIDVVTVSSRRKRLQKWL